MLLFKDEETTVLMLTFYQHHFSISQFLLTDPTLTVTAHGGVVISVRDTLLGGKDTLTAWLLNSLVFFLNCRSVMCCRSQLLT